jgi:hypothetical protein
MHAPVNLVGTGIGERKRTMDIIRLRVCSFRDNFYLDDTFKNLSHGL